MDRLSRQSKGSFDKKVVDLKKQIYNLKNSVSILHFSAFGIFHIKDIVVMDDI